MEDVKIVTICGSMKFKKIMMQVAEKLELENNWLVIQCIYGESSKSYTDLEVQKIAKIHYKKIDISDAIFVVNVDGYIGEATKREIEYAESLGKKVFYLEAVAV